jgi:hypothetical protein
MDNIFNLGLLRYVLISAVIVVGPIILGLFSSVCNVQSTLSKRRFIVGYIEAAVYNFICVPIHELSHLLFSIIFGHRITDVQLFPRGGDPGHVTYRYNKNSLYQRMGCYVSAIAPFIVSTILLCVLYWVCMSAPVATVEYAINNFFQYKDYSAGIGYLLDAVHYKPIVVICTIILVFSASSSKADRQNAVRNCIIPLIFTFIILLALHFMAKRVFDVIIMNVTAIYVVYFVLILVVYLFNRLLIALKIF